ncbi:MULTISPECIES: cupin domain-containing protein [Paraburkholderia]|uniref:Mannose-6-phosphate isomerase-like protein (Cupin superfamily) n=1 Tax=Paraburkholderia tropica TaxID=92647 RepID=A0ABX5MUB1_9BURK|nr:cupin domain-containing protein [Paraburkholderia tropica]MBB2980171.1 quercetin dioxygenase-like cupin family protein [Paraburkholderia tropica]MBB3001278.1 quercetin dioxygenase-like cupin family protein [Paraburkholderia tropica]MBB6320910.1 quercetin dioxygenase-like cupin family protein [Paraburkholderia tropica]MDE1140646.1 cupin domain-containing protein [Paraburkholderia tropica]OBR52760.1 cupin [Paraburkholderia tropica]
MSRPQAVPTVQVSNPRAIVTEWRFAPGAETGWHVHGHDYIVVPQTDGVLLIETRDGPREKPLVAGQSYAGLQGVEHNVVNASPREVVFVEVEIK